MKTNSISLATAGFWTWPRPRASKKIHPPSGQDAGTMRDQLLGVLGGSAAVLEPYSKRLWIIGGSYNFEDEEVQVPDMEYLTQMLVMSFNSATPLYTQVPEVPQCPSG